MNYFPIQSLMSYDSCYDTLSKVLHPDVFACPCGSALPVGQVPHKRNKTGLPSFRCKECKGIFNIYSKTVLEGIHYDCIKIILLLRGILKGETTQSLSKELQLNYKNLLTWRHKLQEFAYENRLVSKMQDPIIESEEVFINAGSKGEKHSSPQDPPRVRANKKKA